MRLAATTSLSTLALLLAGPALAQTRTSQSGDVTNASGTTLAPTSGAAITIDSNNAVTNAGAITQTDVNGIIGIATSGSRTGSITNSGSISLSESYTASDTNGDTIIDPPFASGSGRYGIKLGSDGTFTGAISSSGTITIKGNGSAAIYADAPITGAVTSTGAISVTGDQSYGVRLGQVTGNIAITGGVAVSGTGSEAVSLNGPVTGQVVIRGTVTTNGYSVTALPTTLTSLLPGNLNQGGPALRIGGSVSGGVFVGGTPTTTDSTDADGDGIADSGETVGAVTSYGSAPAVLVGSSTAPVTLGTFQSTGAGLVLNGYITGTGIYAGINATALQVGGMGQPVVISGGIQNGGSIGATANTAQATALWLQSGASTPQLVNTGMITAQGITAAGASARAIVIDPGASLPTITNSGSISASVAFANGRATAILDSSGTLASVTNTGSISASDVDGGARAIDVSANTTGFTYTQAQATGTTNTPSLKGAIVTGSGQASLLISAGTAATAVTFGAANGTIALSGTGALSGSTAFTGSGNRLTLADTAHYTGATDFAGGTGTLTIGGSAVYAGTIANGGRTAVAVSGGTLSLTGTGTTTLASLSLTNATLGVALQPASGTAGLISVAGATTIGSGSVLRATVTGLATGSQTFTVLRSGTLTGTANLTLSTAALPYLMTAALSGSDAAGSVAVTLSRKTAAQLGFNRSETAAYDAVYAAILSNSQLDTLFTGLTDSAGTISRYRQILPDHAGGLFDLVTTGVRALNAGEGAVPLAQVGGLGIWASQAYWGARQHSADTGGWRGNGWGLTAGADLDVGKAGRVGVSIGYLYGTSRETVGNDAALNQFQGGIHWLTTLGGFSLSAYGVAGLDHLDSTRDIDGNGTTTTALLTSHGKWNGSYFGGGGKIAYEIRAGAFFLRPTGGISYGRLHENAHSDQGGGAGFDLTIDARNSDELAATGTVALGAKFGGSDDPEDLVWRFELEGGRRQVIGGSVGATTAHFAGGQDFTLLPDQRQSGYTGNLSASVGTDVFRVVATAQGDTRPGYRGIIGRVGVRGFF